MSKVHRLLQSLCIAAFLSGCTSQTEEIDQAEQTERDSERLVVVLLPISPTHSMWEFTDGRALKGAQVTFEIQSEDSVRQKVTESLYRPGRSWLRFSPAGDLQSGERGASCSFISKRPLALFENMTLSIVLTLPRDTPCMSPFKSGYLPKGTYRSSGKVEAFGEGPMAVVRQLGPVWTPVITNTFGWQGMLTPEEAEKYKGLPEGIRMRKYYVSPSVWNKFEHYTEEQPEMRELTREDVVRRVVGGPHWEQLPPETVIQEGKNFVIMKGPAETLDTILNLYDEAGKPLVVIWDQRRTRLLPGTAD